MKLILTRATSLGVVSIEEEVPTQGIVDVTRRVRAALDQAVAELVPRPTIAPDRTSDPGPAIDHALAVAADPGEAPKTGRDLWNWALLAGETKRVIELGRACGLKAATRRDVFGWLPADVAHIYHEIRIKPTSGATVTTGRARP